ncbi:unnamed protein product [Closterium sp. NIES-53]
MKAVRSSSIRGSMTYSFEDLITHLRTSDTRYRAALKTEFLDKNPPPMYITLYFIVTRLPESLSRSTSSCTSFSASTSGTPRHSPLLCLPVTRSQHHLRTSPILARYVAPGRHRPEHWEAAKGVVHYLCSTSGMGLVLGGRGLVVLTGHADASWVDDLATRRSPLGYTFSLGSGSVSWWSTRLSSVLSSSCEAEIYAGDMAAQDLRCLTYLLTDLGERPRSPPVLTKHIALRYFLARELQQRGQLRLAYVATRANTADIFTNSVPPSDHQRFSILLGLSKPLLVVALSFRTSEPTLSLPLSAASAFPFPASASARLLLSPRPTPSNGRTRRALSPTSAFHPTWYRFRPTSPPRPTWRSALRARRGGGRRSSAARTGSRRGGRALRTAANATRNRHGYDVSMGGRGGSSVAAWVHDMNLPPPSRPSFLPNHLPPPSPPSPPLPPPLLPLPPRAQVRGAEAENLAKTRVAQRDIWERQFPPGDCQGQRLLVLPWSTQDMRGVGSGSVIEQTKQYPSWQFHYSTNPRLPHGANDTRAYEFMQDVAVSLASVLIAAECDYFVGSLESNWSRLINELRSTNGRLYAGFIALNIGL